MARRPDHADIAELIEAAVEHARASAWTEAAALVIQAWRRAPSARLAMLLVAIEKPLPPPAPVRGDTVGEREDHWHALADTKDDQFLATLLAEQWPVHPKGAKARVRKLEEWPRSPRISITLMELLRRGRYRSAAGRVVSRRMYALLFAMGDPAVSAQLEELESEQGLSAETERRHLVAVLRRRRPAEPVWSPRETAALAALDTLVATGVTASTQTLDELLAAVYAAPLDDGPRSVIGDYLIERADPRGELIALQLARVRTGRGNLTRERALIRNAGKLWTGPLEDDGATDIEFARGFPAAAYMRKDAFTAVEWATIETLSLSMDPLFRGDPKLTALRELAGARMKMLGEMTFVRELDSLWFWDMFTAGSRLDGPTRAAPKVLVVDVVGVNNGRTLIGALARDIHAWPIGRRLVGLHLRTPATMLTFAGELLDTTRLDEITLDSLRTTFDPDPPGNWYARLTRDALRIYWQGPFYLRTYESIVDLVRGLAPRLIAEVDITGTRGGHEHHPEMKRKLTAIFERWPTVTAARIFD